MGGGASARDVADALVAERAQVEAAQQMLPAPEQDGRNDQVQFVDETCRQVLPDRRDAAASFACSSAA